MEALLNSFVELLVAATDLLWAVGSVVLPWLPLVAWIAYWMFAVNWVRLRETLARGGWIGLLLLGTLAVIVWGSIAPPASGSYDLYGLTISNYVGKTVFVTGLICLMLLAGAAQLSGFCSAWCDFSDETVEDEHHQHGHDSAHAHAAAH